MGRNRKRKVKIPPPCTIPFSSYIVALKRIAYIPLLGLALMLCACPYRSAHSLAGDAALPIDSNLLGKWAVMVLRNTGKEEPVKLIVTAATPTLYQFAITGYLNELKPHRVFTGDSILGTAALSSMANRQFLDVQLKDYRYIAELQWEKGQPSILPMAENFTGKLIKSSAELRMALEHHCKTRYRPTYDEAFCLYRMVRVN
jgi:hypothetical protein